MFDLVDKLSKNTPTHHQLESKCAFLYQTAACKHLVKKAFRFDGLPEPISYINLDSNYTELQMQRELDVVIIELNTSKNIAEDAKLIAHQIPTSASVVIIGNEDAISTIRALKQLGFYYLFWPASESEVMEFYHNVERNHHQQNGVAVNRKAKQVAVLGVKGGVGTSLIASEVSRALAKHHAASVLLVDHTYTGSNIDVLLGLQKFTKRSVQKGTLVSNIDSDFAGSLVQQIHPNLSIVALESEAFSRSELHEYTQALKEQTLKDYSFVIEDYSHTVTTNADFERAVVGVDTLVIVFDATVSSLRELNRIVSDLEVSYPELQLLTVLNNTRPQNTASISVADVEKYFGREPDAQIAFEYKANHFLLKGQLIYDKKSEMSSGLQNIVARLVGEKPSMKKAWLSRWLRR